MIMLTKQQNGINVGQVSKTAKWHNKFGQVSKTAKWHKILVKLAKQKKMA